MLNILLKAGANPDAKTTSGKSLLSIAVTSNNLDACKTLIEYESDLNAPDNGGSTPLMWAIQNATPEELEIIELLLDSGADVNRVDMNGLTAFDRFCKTNSDIAIGRALVRAGANVRALPDKTLNMSSIMMAAQQGNTDLCYFLIDEVGLDPHVVNANGHRAADFARYSYNAILIHRTKGYIILADKLEKYVRNTRVDEDDEESDDEDD
jgi:ankyrin repeat protein